MVACSVDPERAGTTSELDEIMRRRLCSFTRLSAASTIFVAVVALGGPAGASSACGELSLDFPAVALLNNGVDNTAGPFPIAVPSGSYTVIMDSFDDHSIKAAQITQTEEQWHFVLDGGYVSPNTTDIADDQNGQRDVFSDQEIAASSAITLVHRGHGNVNSVHPKCVGFVRTVEPEPAPIPVEEVITPIEPDLPLEAVEPEPEQTPIESAVEPTEGIVDEPADEAANETAEPLGGSEQVASSNGITREPAEHSTTPASVPQLALTGPSATWSTAVIGLSLLMFGAIMRFVGVKKSRGSTV